LEIWKLKKRLALSLDMYFGFISVKKEANSAVKASSFSLSDFAKGVLDLKRGGIVCFCLQEERRNCLSFRFVSLK